MKNVIWEKVKWFGSDEKPYCDWECWQWKNVVLYPGQWPDKGWSYVRRGATSQYAHSGFLPGCITLQSAKDKIVELVAGGKIVP